jgi:aspartate racemase
MKIPGIIGGLGPATTAEFYLELIGRARQRYPCRYPRVLINSVPVPFELERSIVLFGRDMEQMYPLLEETALALQEAGADFIALPCNTVHQFHPRLQDRLSVPLLNILEITASRCAARGYGRTAVLGTRRTVETGLYEPALRRHGLEPAALQPAEVELCADLIYRLLAGEPEEGDRGRLLELASSLAERGAEAVILGCTDLQLLVRPGDADLPVPAVDSVDALLEESVRLIGDGETRAAAEKEEA